MLFTEEWCEIFWQDVFFESASGSGVTTFTFFWFFNEDFEGDFVFYFCCETFWFKGFEILSYPRIWLLEEYMNCESWGLRYSFGRDLKLFLKNLKKK